MIGLHVDSVIKSFGSHQLLTDVFLSLKVGEIVGVLGRNGCGKSTLLKIVFGSMSAERKFVRIDSKILNNVVDSYPYISYLPQDNFIPGQLTVKKVVQLYCKKSNVKIIRNNALIKPLLNAKCKSLSSGELRFLEILITIFSGAKYILLDEPFNGIAPLYKEEVKNTILEVSKTKAFIVTDHDYRNILDIATKNILIHDGGTKPIKNLNELVKYGYLPE